jgi:sugar (pentulose or hexulose) kinase
VPANPILVIDAGTSALRAVSVSCDGNASTVARREWQMFTPDDASSFARELRGGDVMAAFDSLIAEACPATPRYAGIAVTGQREGVVFLDGAGEPLLVSPNIDGRASSEGMRIDEAHRDELYATTGHLPALMQAPAKLAWLRAQRPRDAERVRTIVPLADWIASLLTGERVASRSLASEVGLIDLRSGAVAADLLAKLDVAKDFVPAVVHDGTAAGRAREGPLAGRDVALAGADTQCALAAMGCLEAGAGIVAGWSAPAQLVMTSPVFDKRVRTWTGLHVIPDRWVIESNVGESGRAWQWLLDLMSVSHEEAEALATASPAGARDALAVLGPREMQASSMTVGIGAMTFPLPSAPSRGDVLRSALEAIAYGVRANLEQLEEIVGVRSDRIALGGGMSRSRLFARIVRDVIGRPIDVANAAETTAVGAAIVGSPALGLHDTIEQAGPGMSRWDRREPDLKASAVYEDCYARWDETARVLEQGLS